jgi:glucosylceramidase
MINDFNSGTVGWTDWNILLNEEGGPNHVENYCFAPVHGDRNSGDLIFTPTYYYIGHFSRFIKPGAERISTSCSRSFLQSTTFVNSNGTFATVVINMTDQDLNYQLYVYDQKIDVSIPARAIQTLIY